MHMSASCTVCIHKACIPMLQMPQIEASRATTNTFTEIHAAICAVEEVQSLNAKVRREVSKTN